MGLIDELPKEVAKDKFEKFLKQVKRDFSAKEYPELFVEYQERDGKMVILGIGESNECAEQLIRVFNKYPSLREKGTRSKMLRPLRAKFLLR